MLSSKDQRQLRGVVQAHTKDTADVQRSSTSAGNGDCLPWLLSSSSVPSEEAPFGSGLFEVNSDEVTVNSVEIMGRARLLCQHVVDGSALPPNFFRFLLVWFDQPTQLADPNGGVLPPITEVIPSFNVNNCISAPPLSSTASRGSFTVLSDKTLTLGLDASGVDLTTGATAPLTSGTSQLFHWKIPVNRVAHFEKPASTLEIIPGDQANGGHWASNRPEGCCSRGLLMAYIITAGSSAYESTFQFWTRINYTG